MGGGESGEGGREQFVIQWLQAIHHRNWVSNAASCESLLPCQRFNTLHWECKSCLKFGTNCTASDCTRSHCIAHTSLTLYTRAVCIGGNVNTCVHRANMDTVCRQKAPRVLLLPSLENKFKMFYLIWTKYHLLILTLSLARLLIHISNIISDDQK